MTIATFNVKNPRPTKLSDPFQDYLDYFLVQLLATPDDDMQFSHYRNLLGPYLPAGTYDESVYFLPGAFRYFVANEEYALEIVTALIGFVSIHKDRLEQDGILEIVRDCIRECFERWTGEFVVVHDLMAEGAPIGYYDHVKNTAFVASTIAELARFETHVDIAEKFLRDLTASADDPVKAAWFLEFAASRFQYAEPIEQEAIIALIEDQERLNRAADIVRRHSEFIDAAPTYWRDTFKLLNID